ncbi:MAG: class I SAM-dependent methyltransferase [Acidobacteriota bacterium]
MTVCPVCSGLPDRVLWRGRGRGGIRRVRRCGRCHTGFADPMPAAGTLQAHYSDEYFARHYGGNRQTAQRRCDRLLATVEQRAGTSPGRLLDIGCGVGDLLSAARRRGWQVTGIEAASVAARQARAAAGGETIEGDAARCLEPQPDAGLAALAGPFDLVVLRDVLGHLAAAGAVLRGAVSRLRAGGHLVVRTPNHHAGVFRVARSIGWLRDASGVLHLPAQVLHIDREAVTRILAFLGLSDCGVTGESERRNGEDVRYSTDRLANWFWHRCLATWERRGEPETLLAWGRRT